MLSLCSYTQNNNYCSVVDPKYANTLASLFPEGFYAIAKRV
jgi:hypothetical protein